MVCTKMCTKHGCDYIHVVYTAHLVHDIFHPVRNHLKSIYTLLTSKDKILANFSIQQLTGYGAMLTKKSVGNSCSAYRLMSIPRPSAEHYIS